jgi:trehalose/maltose transport system substrate-binding protein
MSNLITRCVAGLVGLVLVAATWSSPAAAQRSSIQAVGAMAVPNVPPAILQAAKKFKGQTILFYGPNIGTEMKSAVALAKKFSQQTGIHVKFNPMPASATDQYATYQRVFSAHSSTIDVADLDVIWPGAFAPYLLNLKSAAASETKGMFHYLVKNNMVNGKLVALPWFENHALLWYRTDLLKKYHISGPPKTWDQLAADAKTIQTGEQKTNKNFHGYVFQGNAYEGLTCDAMEWVSSSGGGTFVTPKGQVTIDNPKAIAMLNKVRKWVGAIAPTGVTSYEETDSMNAFAAGDAAFLRNWLYAGTVSGASGSVIRGKFSAEALPAQPGQKHVSTFGGSILGVNKYSKHPGAATQFVLYMGSVPGETYWTLEAGDPPAVIAVQNNPAVLKAEPWLRIKEGGVARPSTILGAHYNQASTIIFQGVNEILRGSDAASILPGMKSQLQVLLR